MSEQSDNGSEPDSGTDSETEIETKITIRTSGVPTSLRPTEFPASTLFLDAEGQHWFGQIPPPPLPAESQFESAWANNHSSPTMEGTTQSTSKAHDHAFRTVIPEEKLHLCGLTGDAIGIPTLRPSLSLFEVKKPWKVKSISGSSADTVGKVFRCVYTYTPTAEQQEKTFTGLV